MFTTCAEPSVLIATASPGTLKLLRGVVKIALDGGLLVSVFRNKGDKASATYQGAFAAI